MDIHFFFILSLQITAKKRSRYPSGNAAPADFAACPWRIRISKGSSFRETRRMALYSAAV
jgi:hypothetical protein